MSSVIPAERRKAYAERGTDDLGKQLSEHIKGPHGEPSAERLQAFAVANGVWQDGYARLNVGMQRMNVANRLRALVRKGHVIVWPDQVPPKRRRGRPRKSG